MEPEDHYNYPHYDELAGVSPLEVQYVLDHGRPRIRHHIGSVLRIIARDRQGQLLMVTCMETVEDNTFDITAARYLDEDEARAAEQLLGGQS